MGHHIKVVETFLNYGVHVDELDVVGRTPLHLAVVLGNVKMVNLLLSWGANVSMQDGLGRTPKEWAEQLKRHHINKLFEDL
jgi:ankyrin repeat protein